MKKAAHTAGTELRSRTEPGGVETAGAFAILTLKANHCPGEAVAKLLATGLLSQRSKSGRRTARLFGKPYLSVKLGELASTGAHSI